MASIPAWRKTPHRSRIGKRDRCGACPRRARPTGTWVGCVKAQRLDRILTCYRIADPEGSYPIFDTTASRLYPGRWNTPASPVIYASEHYSTAMLEKLVHGNGQVPPNQHFILITIPNGAA